MRVYITQFGFWWSTTTDAWQALVAAAIAAEGEYDLEHAPGFRALSGRPSTVRVEDNEHTGRRYYYDIAGHTIHRPLDWTLADWLDAVEVPVTPSQP